MSVTKRITYLESVSRRDSLSFSDVRKRGRKPQEL